MNGIRIEGERIAVREFRSDDHDAVYRLMGDSEVVRYLSWKSLTHAQCVQRLHEFIFDQHCRASRERFRWSGNSAPSRALQKRAIRLNAEPPVRCSDEADCRRYRYYFAVELLPSGRVIGEAGFEWSSKDRTAREAVVGYFLEQEFWGLGYATEAARLVINFAFSKLSANKVIAACDPRNRASERVMLKCGLRSDSPQDERALITKTLTRSQWLGGQFPESSKAF